MMRGFQKTVKMKCSYYHLKCPEKMNNQSDFHSLQDFNREMKPLPLLEVIELPDEFAVRDLFLIALKGVEITFTD